MRNYFVIILSVSLLIPYLCFTQEPVTQGQNPPPVTDQKQQKSEPNHINSGFYLKLGPAFPIGNYFTKQVIYDPGRDSSVYLPAKMGAAMDMGFLIYIGPAFANNILRFGIDATFISCNFNSVKSDTLEHQKYKYWYYYIGQKFGPVLSICPVDRLVIDLSYKLNAYVSYVHHYVRGTYNDEWGKNLTQGEISMNIRYSVILFSLQYNYGKVQYDDFDSDKPVHYVDNTTYRIMVGFKF